ncbi:globin-coupled sensor protein [Salinadaptatus halalkaliphilus]|uniref:Globin-coupled sensor protein n=1 Tax=Salinadaptatus halalkaliphilus TaxID=2419781 RepID=A0A4S3TLZ3_9EURY|nr:globin-coupled sensor protein [Salinadaptatus halalkaliphilus]THE65231.1 globin-coupled sensor protein [Salinadaptatus halalkaliphilus]
MHPEQTFGGGQLNEYVDVEELVANIGLDEADVAWRKDFIGFDDDDARRLADLEPLLRDNQEAIADDFYDNLVVDERTREIIERSPKGIDALKQTQRAYLVSLASGDYDRSYFQNRARIGKLHELLDMPLKQYVGQYGVYYDLLLDRLNERIQDQVIDAVEEWATDREQSDRGGLGGLAETLGFGTERDDEVTLEESFEETIRGAIDDGLRDVLALLKVINLDMQVAVETYVDSYAQRLERSIDRRKQLAHEVETDVQGPIDELHETSEVVADRAERISAHTSTQADAVGRAASELSEISAGVEEIASVADDVSEESERTERLAAAGVESADDALDDLQAIEDATARVEGAATDLEARTDDIDDILERLEDVADRTTMLATNAKIESSRSEAADGTMGVIADEVRSFADQTKADIAAIEDAVEDVRADARRTVETTEETVRRVDDGTDRVRETVTSLEEIHEAARSTAAGIDEVTTATDQQARSVETTAGMVDDLSTTADRVATAAESLAAASQEQTASLQQVSQSVGRLTDEEPQPRTPIYERIG